MKFASLPWPAGELEHAHEVTSRGRPYLYLASTLLADPVKRAAFEVAYASMRLVDDAIDLRGAETPAAALRRGVAEWMARVRAAHAGAAGEGDVMQASLQRLFRNFALPLEPWESMARVLTEDVGRDGFATLEDFLSYAEGAAVGPARLFAMLSSALPTSDGYAPHPSAWSPAWATLGRFTYLVHGLRDLAEDLEGPMRGSALAPRAELAAHGLDPESLSSAAPIVRRRWAMETADRAAEIRASAGEPWRAEGLPEDGALVLEFVVALYARQLQRIVELDGEVFTDAHRLGPGDVMAVAEAVCGRHPAAPPAWRALLEAALPDARAPRA